MANGRKFELNQEIEMQDIEPIESDDELDIESMLHDIPHLSYKQVNFIWDISLIKIDFLARLPTQVWLNIFALLDDKATLQLSSTCKTMRSLWHYKWPQKKNYKSIEPQAENSFEILPHELILFIYKLLDVKSVLQLSMTCKLLSNLTNKFDKEMRRSHFIEIFDLLKPAPNHTEDPFRINIMRNGDLSLDLSLDLFPDLPQTSALDRALQDSRNLLKLLNVDNMPDHNPINFFNQRNIPTPEINEAFNDQPAGLGFVMKK